MINGLFVGMCGLDITYYDDGPLPLENTKGKYLDYTTTIGGPATNAAITFAYLNGKATLVCALGNSELAKTIKAQLNELNVEVIDLIDDDRQINISSIHVNKTNGDRTILSGQMGKLTSYPTLGLTDYDFIEYDGSLLGLEQQLIATNLPLVLDVGSDKESYLPCFRSEKAIPITTESYSHLDQNIAELAKSNNFQRYAITRGSRSIIYSDQGNSGEIATTRVKAIDTLGAGDIFHGAFCYGYFVKRESFKDALTFASKFASYSTEVVGVIEGIKHALVSI